MESEVLNLSHINQFSIRNWTKFRHLVSNFIWNVSFLGISCAIFQTKNLNIKQQNMYFPSYLDGKWVISDFSNSMPNQKTFHHTKSSEKLPSPTPQNTTKIAGIEDFENAYQNC